MYFTLLSFCLGHRLQYDYFHVALQKIYILLNCVLSSCFKQLFLRENPMTLAAEKGYIELMDVLLSR